MRGLPSAPERPIVLMKKRHLEEFIAKNKARASTATRARSKSKQLEKLEVIDIASDEPTANIRAPEVEPRKGPAVPAEPAAATADPA